MEYLYMIEVGETRNAQGEHPNEAILNPLFLPP